MTDIQSDIKVKKEFLQTVVGEKVEVTISTNVAGDRSVPGACNPAFENWLPCQSSRGENTIKLEIQP